MKKPKIYDSFIVLHNDKEEFAVNIDNIVMISKEDEGTTLTLQDREGTYADEDFDDILKAIGEDY